MHFSFLAAYWWIVLAAMVAVFLGFVLVAGRGAEGGFTGRTQQGWRRWRALSQQASELQARIILSVFYFTVAAPFGLIRTHLADPLDRQHRRRQRHWHPRTTRDRTLEDARKQY